MNKNNFSWKQAASLGLIAFALAGCAEETTKCNVPANMPVSATAYDSEAIFASPQEAADALIDANRRDDKAALLKILGPHAKKIISSGDKIADKEGRERFVNAYDKAHTFEAQADGKQILVVGEEEWPMPIPLIQINGKGWQFDTEDGAQEIINRRIGRNEIYAIKVARNYVEAQREYAVTQKRPDGEIEYAQHFISHPGKHDGLYWPTKDGEAESPLGPMIAAARTEGYKPGKQYAHRHPYHGYYYKILREQGPHAAGGAKNYMENGRMTGGFALIAYPADYGNSGIMSFIVDQNGVVFEKNLGPRSAYLAAQMKSFDPDESWLTATLP